MEEDFFKVGYTTCLQKQETEKKKWTSNFLQKILKHKIITASVLTIFICVGMNMWLVYRFMDILSKI